MITNNLKYSKYATALVVCGLIIFLILKIINPLESDNIIDSIKYYWGIIGQTTGYLGVISVIFCTYCWKWKIFYSWLVPFPNLNGTWKGVINSTWINPKANKKIPAIPAVLSIKQSFKKISCVLYTQEMKSISYNASFILMKIIKLLS